MVPFYQINTYEDLEKLPLNEPFHVEIRLEAAVLPWKELPGHCVIKAQNCRFPKLERIRGTLSIDAPNPFFPKLKVMDGNCKIRTEEAQVPQLRWVKGNLRVIGCLVPSSLFRVDGKVAVAKARTGTYNTVKPYFESSAYCIYEQEDQYLVPLEYKGLICILGDKLKLSTSFNGTRMLILGRGLTFLNTTEFKYLGIICRNSVRPADKINFPQLELIQQDLHINSNGLDFPILKEVGGIVLIEHDGNATMNELQSVKSIHVHSKVPIVFKKLDMIQSAFSFNTTANAEGESCFPALRRIGRGIHLLEHVNLPALEEIDEIVFLDCNKIFDSIRSIGILHIEDSVQHSLLSRMPNLQKVHKAIAHPLLSDATDLVENVFCRISESMLVSEHLFCFNTINEEPYFPIDQLVAILKMRHNSYQNFLTREYEREWLQDPFIAPVLKAIENGWEQVKAFTFEDIFRLESRNLRRFCFNYIGVAAMMEALEAKRLHTAGVEMHYFRYDEEGHKIPFSKHNIYEVYEADVDKFEDLITRRGTEKVYAVKCWCTSTNKEHWLWIEEQYKDDPLAAIASTFRIHENVIPYIKCLKRQGDVMICEMKEQVIPEGAVRPLTKEEYFGLLEGES
jgi:hypothetical protein